MSSKAIGFCPFSGNVCKECGIFRGRHVGTCGGYLKRHQTGAERPKFKSSEMFVTDWELPELVDDSKTMVNIEDFIERRGL
jgi:hypothetical protein